jgi:hypothetical protein
LQWHLVAAVIEVKSHASQDPFDSDVCKVSLESSDTLKQLAKNGRNLLMGNASCFSFVIGVYGHMAQIYQFDCAGVIVSKVFDYTSSYHILGEFLWRFVHPNDSSGIVGLDFTLLRPTEGEKKEVLEHIYMPA